MKKKHFISLLIIVAVAFSSCGTKNSKEITIETELVAEGPFFEGGNSFMAQMQPDLKKLLGDDAFKEAGNIQLTSVDVTIPNGQVDDLSIFNNASFQFLSETSPMTTVAILNPMKFEGNKASLTTSDEAELIPFFEEKEFTALLDLDFSDYVEVESMTVMVKMNFKVEY